MPIAAGGERGLKVRRADVSDDLVSFGVSANGRPDTEKARLVSPILFRMPAAINMVICRSEILNMVVL